MQKQQRKWRLICAEINQKLTSFTDGPKALSELSGIDYYAARRFLISGVHNNNKNVRRLCIFFKIEIAETAKSQPGLLGMLTSVLKDVWDGSEPHADLIAELIKTAKTFKVVERIK